MKRRIISSSVPGNFTWAYGKSSGQFEEALKYYTSWSSISEFESHVLKQPFSNLSLNGYCVFKANGELIVRMKDGAFRKVNSLLEFIQLAAPSGEIKSMDMSDRYNKPDKEYFQEHPDEIPEEYLYLYGDDRRSKRTVVSPGGRRQSAYDRELSRAQATGNKWALENFKATH